MARKDSISSTRRRQCRRASLLNSSVCVIKYLSYNSFKAKYNMKISVISPVYGAASLLKELVKEIETAVLKLPNDYEIILVEDHSPDNSQSIIREICSKNKHVIGAFHSRNFGQQYAIHTGLSIASGDYIVTLDCDLQDTPALIVDLYN